MYNLIRKKFFGATFIASLGVFCSLSSTASAAAEQAMGVRVQPSIIEERAERGQTLSFILHATNIGTAARTFYIIKNNISAVDAAGRPSFAKEGEPTGFEVSSWISIPKDPLTIAPGQTKDIPFTIAISKDASPGAHLGIIFLSIEAERPKQTGIGIGYQVGTIINLRIAGDAVDKARIREFRTDKSIYSHPNVQFTARLENMGNTVVRPRGPIDIMNFFGKKVATLIMNDSAAAIVPKGERTFALAWAGDPWSFGRYEAVMSLVYGEDAHQTISSSASFWVLPFQLILPAIGGAIGIILFGFIFIKWYIQKKIASINPALPPQRKINSLLREAVTISILVFLPLAFLAILFLFFV